MKNVLAIAIAIILSVAASLVLTKKNSSSPVPQKESVYDRVMRTQTVKAGYFPWPGYFDVDPNTKELTGSSKELCDAVFKMLGLKVEYVLISANIVQDLDTGKIDTRCGDSPWALKTVNHIDYTTPFYGIPAYIFVRSDETRFATVADLNKKDVRFIGLDGDTSTELVQNNLPQATIQSYPITVDVSQLLTNLTTNKADAFIVDPLVVEAFNASNDVKLKALFPEKPYAVYPVTFSVKKGEERWFRTLDFAVHMAHDIGLVDPILAKHDPSGKKLLRVLPGYQIK